MATYVYRDASGEMVGESRRYEGALDLVKGKPVKTFSWRRPGPDGGWIYKMPDPCPLYRLPDLVAARSMGGTPQLWLVEGEKNADRLAEAGVLAVSAPNGAHYGWREEYTAQFAGSHVTIVADRDEQGYARAASVAAELEPVAASVRVVRTPIDRKHADASDHLDAGLALSDFEPFAVVATDTPTAIAEPATATEGAGSLLAFPGTAGHKGDDRSGTVGMEGSGRRRRMPPPVFRRTDYGNAERLVHHHGADLLNHRGQWYVWDGTRFRIDETGAVERLAKKTVRSIWLEAKTVAENEDAGTAKKLGQHAADSESRSRLVSMVALAATELPVIVDQADDLDSDPWLLNCTNGTIDLRTGTLRAHSRKDRITRSTKIAADMSAPAPTWEAFLARILPDPGVREFLQRIVGYTLTGLTSEEKLFILNGDGSNGKSTMIEAISTMMGEYGMPAPPDLLISKRPGGPSNDVAALRGSRLASATETEEGAQLNEVRTKALVTGDRQSARFLHKEFFEFRPTAKYWISTNHRPIVRGSDAAIWRRMVLLPFDATISDEEKDRDLGKKLRAEAPGILAWAVRGCLAWQRDGLRLPSAIQSATAGYRAEQDLIGSFLDDACVLHPRAEAPATPLYQAYRTWCEDAGENAQSQRRFGQRLSERPGLFKLRSGTVTWYGIGLRAGGAWDYLLRETAPAETSPAPPPPASQASPAVPCPCPTCLDVTAIWCGFGDIADDKAQCLVCGQLTATRARCGAIRHGNCYQPPAPPPESDPGPLTQADATPDVRPAPSSPRSLCPAPDAAEPRIDPAEELSRFSRAVRDSYPDATEDDLRAGLALWTEALDGLRFVSYPGEVGIAAYARLVARHGAMVVPTPIEGQALEGIKPRLSIDYLTPKLVFPEDCWVTGTDINAQYLAAARSVEVGDGEPVVGSPNPLGVISGNMPGYVQMARVVQTKRLGFGERGTGKLARGEWITTQTAKYLIKDRGLELPIGEIVYWPKHGRRLDKWAALFAGAYVSLKASNDLPARYALAAVKLIYTSFLNGMLRSGRYNHTALHRPDWSDQVRTLAYANQLRALDKVEAAGHCPIGVYRDATWWAHDKPDKFVPPGLVIAAGPGKWKIDRHAEMDADMRAAYEDGSVERFRAALAAACGIAEQRRGEL